MSETKAITLSYKEVVEALIKYQDYHEGIWQLFIEFGLGATNIATAEDQVSPAAIVPINKIGLLKVDKEGPLAVNAATVNPLKNEPKIKNKSSA